MSGERCPSCGGLVAPEAEWCGQCFAQLRGAGAAREPEPAEPAGAGPPPPGRPRTAIAAATGPGGIAREHFTEVDGALHWICPACEAENPMEASTCARCMTPFALLLREREERKSTDPGKATGLSLLYPGLGHIAAGRPGEGVARMVIFTWALASLLVVVAARAGKGLGPLLSLVVIYFLVSGLLYLLTAVDARRAALGEEPVVGSRVLLWGASGVMLLTVVILVFTGLGAAR